MFRTVITTATLALVSLAAASSSQAQVFPVAQDQIAASEEFTAQDQAAAEERLMIVNRNTGRVIYDDGRNDLFCATRLYVVGYTDWGRPIYRRNMRCR
jgi:hypothetical protein